MADRSRARMSSGQSRRVRRGRTLSIKQTAAILGLASHEVRERVRDGRIPAVAVNGGLVVPRAVFEEVRQGE